MKPADFLVIGAGVVGVAVAREIKRRHSDCTVCVVDKEPGAGRHASGRNSGVLHAGFYYTPDSLKARFTRNGNLAWREFCAEHRVPVNVCGKLVVARDESDHAGLDTLLARGRANGIDVQTVSEREALALEPRARTAGRALFSPTTASLDPGVAMAALVACAEREGVEFRYGVEVTGHGGDGVHTVAGKIPAGFVVNAAGLYADRIARSFGFCAHYRILPFKGLYLYSEEAPGSLRRHIYPVPDLEHPFLGVHFTLTVDGHVKIGPTAIPAWWRENYGGLENFRGDELIEILLRQARLFVSNDMAFRRLALKEMRKYIRGVMVAEASRLAGGVQRKDYRRWGRPGIRAQLLDLRSNHLEMDFVLEGDAGSMHVLNAVSPAFTCAMPFAAHVVDNISAARCRP